MNLDEYKLYIKKNIELDAIYNFLVNNFLFQIIYFKKSFKTLRF